MERLERLVNLVAALVDSPRPLTREEIRERVGGYSEDPSAFRRNFERDKDVLRQMGMPLLTVEPTEQLSDEQAGYTIPRDRYELPDPGLDEAELASLRLASSAVRAGSATDEDTTSALRKLAAPQAQPTAPGGVLELSGGEAVVAIFAAITERRRVRLSYHGAAREIDPWRLNYRGGRWYLSGWDHLRADQRMFRLDRIEGQVEPIGEPGAFDPPERSGPASPPPAWTLGDGPATRVTVLVDPAQADLAVAHAGEHAEVERRADGSALLTLAVVSPGAFRSWLLGFLEHAEVLEPQEVRDSVVAWLRALAGAGQPQLDPSQTSTATGHTRPEAGHTRTEAGQAPTETGQ